MKSKALKKILIVIQYLLIYYLSVKMITFAIPKLLFMQFRIPNYSSYVTLNELSKYQHMWSFFGRSEVYNIFIGSAEFLIGALVLFNRTRLIALLISFGTCLNILILNIEFDIIFATSHIILDFAITIILLISYRKDIYHYFIKLGGKINGIQKNKISKFSKIFPVAFLVLLSVGYFMFSLYIKSIYIGDPRTIGAYEIKQISLNDSSFVPRKGSIGKYPMLFLENNMEFALSVEDSLYKGAYIITDKKINIGLKNPTSFGLQYLKGDLDSLSISGEMDEKTTLKILIKRINGKENYLNDLYK